VVLAYPDGRWAYRTEAYDQWISDPGHGVFTKRSFLEEYVGTDQESAAEEGAADAGVDTAAGSGESGGDDGGGALGLVVLALVALAGVGAYALVRRRRSATTIEE
jgi:hypothetical protein